MHSLHLIERPTSQTLIIKKAKLLQSKLKSLQELEHFQNFITPLKGFQEALPDWELFPLTWRAVHSHCWRFKFAIKKTRCV